MAIRLDTRAADFAEKFRAFLATKREAAADVEAVVRAIVADVAARGDVALLEYTQKFDHFDLDTARLRVTAEEIAAAAAACAAQSARRAGFRARPHRGVSPPPVAAGRSLHRRARRRARLALDGDRSGRALCAGRHRRLSIVGADERGAGQGRRRAAPRHGGAGARTASSPPLVLAAAKLAGVDEIYRVGGAQAVAALAYGTATIAPVDKIVGPGNAYVAAAKRLVFGKVGIDMIAGPSEMLVLADRTGNADWIAADLLAQAEHDASAQAILITDDAALAGAVERAVEAELKRPAARRGRRAPPGAISARCILVHESRRRAAAGRRDRARASRNRAADAEALAQRDPQCRRDLPRRAHAGGDRRLCRRLEPRAADRALGALLVRPRRARLHEAHLDPQMRAGATACARPTRRSRSARPKGSTPTPARSPSGSIADGAMTTATRAKPAASSR